MVQLFLGLVEITFASWGISYMSFGLGGTREEGELSFIQSGSQGWGW